MPLDFLKLPIAQPRQFVPTQFDPSDWGQIEQLFRKLIEAAPALRHGKDLVRWLLDGSELASALMEHGTRCYIRMTCHTADPDAERAYLHLVEEIEPKAKPYWFKLQQLYLASPQRRKLPRNRWLVFDRETQKSVELYRPENIPLQTDEAKLEQGYQKALGAMTVKLDGDELTLQQAGRFLEERDRDQREKAWRAIATRRLQDRRELEKRFDRLLAKRSAIARNAGCREYRAYAFKMRSRFDYKPADCKAYHRAVERHIVPLARELHARRAKQLGLARLRPWDLSVDPRGRPPLRPFSDVGMLVERTREIFRRIEPAFAKDFSTLIRFKLLDLESRKGKAPGGYQTALEEARLPFIFMNAVGLQRDVDTLLHEGGHAFHSLAVRDEPLAMYRHAPLEFCEVASMSMELLAHPHMKVFYKPSDAARARRTHLEGVVYVLCWIATIDAFQHWIYTHAGHTGRERRAAWVALLDRFGGNEDWTGLKEERAYLWHRQPHLFCYPFYYIEYGIAQLGALQIWQKAERDLDVAVRKFRRALALGGSKPLPELFRAAGIRFDFSEKTLKPAAAFLRKRLAELEDA
jgi:oligoendopeptidase F